MSDALQFFREQVDPRFKNVSDSDLTEFIYNTYPQFSKDSGFQSSVKRLFDQQAQLGTSAPDFVSDEASQRGRVSSGALNLLRGGATGAGESISWFGRVMNTLAPYVAAGSDNPQARMYGFEEMRRRESMSPTQREEEIQQDPIYQAGKTISGGAAEAFQSNPKYRGEFFTDVLPSSLGGMIPTAAAGMVNPWLGVAQYASSSGEGLAQEAIDAGRPDLANKAAFIGAPIGAITEGMLGQASKLGGRLIVSRLAKGGVESAENALAKEASKPFGRALAETAAKEAGQEGLEQYGQNYAASDIVGYDPNRPVSQGVVESVLAGGVLGVGGEALARGVNRAARAEYNRAADRYFAEEDRRAAPYVEQSANQFVDENPAAGRRVFADPTRQEVFSSQSPVILDWLAGNQEALAGDLGKKIDQLLFNARLKTQQSSAERPAYQMSRQQLESGLAEGSQGSDQASRGQLESGLSEASPSSAEQSQVGALIQASREAVAQKSSANDQINALTAILGEREARLNPEAQSQFGPGARPAPAPDQPSFQPSQSIIDRLRAARQSDQAAIDAANAARTKAPAEAQPPAAAQVPAQAATGNKPKNINDLRDASRSGSLELGQSGTLDDGTEWTTSNTKSGRISFKITRTRNNTTDYGRTWNSGYSVGDVYDIDTGNAQVINIESEREGLDDSNSHLVVSEILSPNEVTLKRVPNTGASTSADQTFSAPTPKPVAKAQTKAAGVDAAKNLQPTVSLPTGPGAVAVGGVPAAAPDISQPPATAKLSGFKPYIDESGDVVERWKPSPLDPNSPPVGIDTEQSDWMSRGGGSYVWRSMGRAEYDKLMAGKMAYGGGKSGRGNYLASYPEKSAKWAGDILVEFAGAQPSGETSKNKLGRDNVTKVWVRSNGAWTPINHLEQQSGQSNANQEQGRVEVPRGNQPQGAPQNAAGQPGPVQVPAGEAVQAVAKAAPQEAKPQLSPADIERNAKIAKANEVWLAMNDDSSFGASDVKSLAKYLRSNELITANHNSTVNSFLKSKDVTGAFEFIGSVIPKPVVAAAPKVEPQKAPAKAQTKSRVAASVAAAPVASPAAAVAPANVATKTPAKAPSKIKAVKKAEAAPAKAVTPAAEAVRPKQEAAQKLQKQAAKPPEAPKAIQAQPAPQNAPEAKPEPAGDDIESKHGRKVAEAVYLARANPGTVAYVTADDDTLIAALTSRDGKTYVRTGIAPNEKPAEHPKYTSWTSLLQSGVKNDSRIKDAYKRLGPETGKWEFVVELQNGYERNGESVIISDSRKAAVEALNNQTELSLKEKGRINNPSANEIVRRQLDVGYWSKVAVQQTAKERGYNKDVTKDSIKKSGNHDIVVGKGESFADNKPVSSGMVIPITPSLTTPSQSKLSEAPAEPKPAKQLRYEKSEKVDIRGNKGLVRAGDWVRVLAPAFGDRLKGAGKTGGVYGIVKSIANGVAQVYVEKIGVRGKGDAKVVSKGIKPGSTWPVSNGKHIVRIEQQLRDFYPPSIGHELGTKLTGLMEKAEQSGNLDHYIETFLAAEGEDSDAINELKKLRKKYGKDISFAMEALHYIEDYYDKKRNRPAYWYVNPGEDVEEDKKFIGHIYRWMADNIESKTRIPFSEIRAKRNTAKDLISNKKTEGKIINREASDAEKESVKIAGPSRIGDSMPPKMLRGIANLIGMQIAESNPMLFGGQAKTVLSKEELARNIAIALSSQYVRSNASNTKRQEKLGKGASFSLRREAAAKIAVDQGQDLKRADAITAMSRIADQIVNQTYDSYKKGGIDAVLQHIEDGDIVLSGEETSLFAATGVSTGNQSLQQGTLSLSDAINTVLEWEPETSLLRTIATNLQASGANPNVVVLSDEQFNALRPGLEGQSAFYDSNPNSDTIYVRQSADSHDYLVMHEAVHSATVHAIRTNPEFRAEMAALREQAKSILGDSSYGLKEHGGEFRNLAEFVAEALSNKEFQQALDSINVSKQQSLWGKFKSLIASLFGFSPEQQSILSRVLDAATVQFGKNVGNESNGSYSAMFGQSPAAESDAAYLDLAKRYDAGDQSVLPQLQSMVDEAAKRAGYKRVYRASRKGAPFLEPRKVSGGGVYQLSFSSRKEVADSYAENPDADTKSFFIRDDGASEFPTRDGNFSKTGFDNAVGSGVLVARNVVDIGPYASTERDPQMLYSYGSDIYATKDFRSNVKSADLITRDSDGNIIPLSQRFNPASDSILFAGRRFSKSSEVAEAMSQPGLSADASDAIKTFASTQAGLIPAATIATLKAAPDDVQTTLGAIQRQYDASAAKAAVSALPLTTSEQIERASEASHGVIKLHREMQDLTANISSKLEKISTEIADNRADDIKDLTDAKNTIAAVSAVTDTMLDDYQSYLRARKDAGIGVGNALDAEMKYVADVLERNYTRSKEMKHAVSLIADFIPAGFITPTTTNADIRTYKDASGVDLEQHLAANKIDTNVIDFLLKPAASGNYRMDGMKRLIPALQLIQKLKANATAAGQYVQHFESAWAKMRGTKDRPVSAAMMARAYASLSIKEKEAVDAARLLSRKISQQDEQLARYTKALQIIEDMQADPGYVKQVGDAANLLNILEPGVLGVDIKGTNKTVFTINGKQFEFDARFDPATDAKNKVTRLAAIAEIDNELASTNDPIRRRSLEFMRNNLSLYGGQLGDAALGVGDFDVINRSRVWIAFLSPLISRMAIYRMIPGEFGIRLRNLAKVGMSLSSEIQKVLENPIYGDFAQNIAAHYAIQSHPGMGGLKWDKEVLNEILGSNQESTRNGLKVGDKIPVYGHVVTKEDMAAAKLQAKFADALYRATKGAERGGILMHHPTLVRETYTVGGETRVQYRNAYASGGLMTPRSFDRSSDDNGSIKLAQSWADTKVDGNPAQTLLNRIALLNEPIILQKFAIGHVTEGNPEYKQDSPLKDAYAQAAEKYRKSDTPSTFDQLVRDIASMTMMTSADPYADVRNMILGEVSERVDRYLSKLNANEKTAAEMLNDSKLSADAMVSIMDSANNFSKPRGELIMPSNFYTHTLSSDSARGAVVNGAMLPTRAHQFEEMVKFSKAIKKAKDSLAADIAAAKAKGVREYIKVKYFDGRRSMMKGTAYASLGVLNTIQGLMKPAIESYKALISKPLSSGNDESIGRQALNTLRTMMVSNIVPAATNYFSALAAGNFMQHTFLNGFTLKKTGFGVAAAPVLGSVNALWKTAALIASNNKQVSAWANANKSTIIPVLRQFADTIDTMNRMKVVAAEVGTSPNRMSLRDRADVIRAIGSYGSPVESDASGGSHTSELIQKAFSKWWMPNIWLAVQGISSTVDRAANVVTLMNIDSALNDVVRSGQKIMENRSVSKTPGWDNWNDAANGITADEAAAAGWSAETLTRLKQIFSNVGGLERVLHSYWQRINAAKSAGTSIDDVAPIADPGFYRDVALELSGLTNAPVESMRQDATRSKTIAGDIYNFVFTFSSWFNGWFDALGTLMAKDSRRGFLSGAGISFMSMALLMALLASNGAWLNEIRGLFYELVKDRPYPVVRLSDVFRDNSPQSIGKLFGASVALMVPYAGEAVADLFGAQNYRASITDIANLSQPLQLLNTFATAIKTGSQTGDWTGQMVRTARSVVPGSDMVLNRVPSVKGMDAVADAVRVARVNSGELELNPRAGGGGGGMQTHASNLVRRAVAESANGNMDEAQKLLQEAAAEKDWKYVQSALRGQNIDVKTFGRQLTPEEKTALLGRMSNSQRETYMRGENAIDQLATAIPAMSGGAIRGGGGVGVGGMRAGGSGTGMGGSQKIQSPFSAFNSKVREIRNKVVPPALRLVKRKISALKPKKLKLPAGKNASAPGSRLLRPVSPGRAGSARGLSASRMPRVPSFA